MDDIIYDECAFIDKETFHKIVSRIKKKRWLYQELLPSIEEETIDHKVDSFKYAFCSIKDPIVVDADKEPIRWLPEA